jgi:hypothetical protein
MVSTRSSSRICSNASISISIQANSHPSSLSRPRMHRKSSSAPNESWTRSSSCSTPRRSPRIQQQVNMWEESSSTRSGLKYGRILGTSRSVKPSNFTWGDGDADEWVPYAWKSDEYDSRLSW